MSKTARLAMLLALVLWLIGTWFLFGESHRETDRVSPPRAPRENASCAILEGKNL